MRLLQLVMQRIQLLAKSLPQLQQRLQLLRTVLLLLLRHHRHRRRLRASAQAVARARPGSPARWRIRMKHW